MLNENSKPLADRVLVQPEKAETEKNGIILIQTAQKQNIGKVILIGVKTQSIKLGDTVQYYPNAGISVPYKGKDCLLLSEENEVICIL